ncbi:uncharacterized protein LOC127432883 isoform X2 [Myxocyprinus asiaticus]|uniref:uncharacterized protein LOC127432883 isoform X2 n=1 Tax=Myxocyprinus asiaticus TaxID=70543 RepID=UPI002223D5AC|nr:uncharacterized protein LOC127432883 isoform X2 [Myxocyprinus asiaticus]
MIDRVLELQKAIAQVFSNDRKVRHLILSWQDIDVLVAIKKSLSPLVEFTDALSGEKYEKTPLETAVMPADDMDDAAGPKKKKKGLGSFFKVTVGNAAGPALQQDQAIALELQSYLQAGTLDTEQDPLDWWRESRALYPRLSNLARKYLCIPTTSSQGLQHRWKYCHLPALISETRPCKQAGVSG